MIPARRIADSTGSSPAGVSGVSGRRMPPGIRPMRAKAHLLGMGLGSTKSA